MTLPNAEPNASPPSPSSGNVWKWIGIGCGGLLVLGMVGIVALVFFVQRATKMSFDSGEADEVARDIIDYEIPGGSQGFMSMDMGMFRVAGVMSQNTPEGTVLVVGELSEAAMQGNTSEMEEAMRRSMEQQQGTITVQGQRVEPHDICGQTVQMTILEGQQTVGGQTETALSHQLFLVHEGQGIFVALTTTGEDAQGKAEQVLQSLECK